MNNATLTDKLYNQTEILNLINQYDIKNPDTRKTIKLNLRRILKTYNIKPTDLIALGYSSPNIYAWTGQVSPNVPMLEQALYISVEFNFSIEEFLKEI